MQVFEIVKFTMLFVYAGWPK